MNILPFQPDLRLACLALFDANCPEYFAPNERADYVSFLDKAGSEYSVCEVEGRVVGAFGVVDEGKPHRVRLNWIVVHPAAQGMGLGRMIIAETISRAGIAAASVVDIAASHKSAPFFAKFGARQTKFTDNGWGPRMHRVDMELPLRDVVAHAPQ